MKKPLIIVESSSKCSKIVSFLNNAYDCVGTSGHICQISDGLNSINSKNVLKTKFKTKSCPKLREAINTHNEIILATDNDREGEAIAWHVCRIFNLDEKKTKRMLFNEITRPAIQTAINNTTVIDMDMVKSQITRQIVDILVGFNVSPLLWKNISSNETLSAGRCQTPTLMLLRDKQIDIENSKSNIIYQTTALFTSRRIKFNLNKHLTDNELECFYKQSINYDYNLSLGSVVTSVLNPPYPLVTSTMQQTMSNLFGYSPKKTMTIAQSLYQKGFITYMRTDSNSYSEKFTSECLDYISDTYGDKFIGKPRTKKIKNSQEAHEAIRPTNLEENVDSLKPEEKRIYNEIKKITIQSCMKPAQQLKYIAKINAPLKTYYHKTFTKIIFQGWKILQQEKEEFYDYVLNLKSETKCKQINSNLDVINKKLYYTEAQLIKRIEEVGIGRPSTYASLLEKIKERGYAEKTTIEGIKIKGNEYSLKDNTILKTNIEKIVGEQKNKVIITHLGNEVLDFLNKHFKCIFNYEFTAKLEETLDDIVNKKSLPETVCCDYLNSIKKHIPKETDDYEIKPGYIFKTGKYGPYIKHNNENIKIKSGITLDKILNKNLSLDDIIYKETNIIELCETISIRNGKYGWYIFYKTDTMKKPQFYTLKKYKFDPQNYDKLHLIEWINNTYSIYG
jgi:DNA topoisomerase-1